MSKSRLIFLFVSLAVLVPIVTGSISGAATGNEEGEDSLSKQLSVFSEVLSLIRRAYVEETGMETLLAGALDGATDALDPLATYVPAGQVERFEEVRRIGPQRSGITVAKERGIAFVVAVEGSSPGAKAGLERADVITSIMGRSTRNLPLWEIQSILAGEPGTELPMETLRRGQPKEITLTLADYPAPVPNLEEVDGVAVLRIWRFDESVAAQLREMASTLTGSGQEHLLIDLRGVAGGSVETAYDLAGVFTQGRLGSLEPQEGAEVTFQASTEPVWSGEPVILIDGGTQGPAEVFAEVLRQNSAARLVGQATFGHAGHQSFLELSDGSRLLLTDSFYAGPDGKPIDSGLEPDLVVDDLSRRFAEQETPIDDLILERGLELLRNGEEAPAQKVA